ncbi:cytosolic phospholipase A2-like isoform X2 [Corticium candelabrum]|nr:cytosolic phospholipase A2-like isoform X2 [Corticium candelabrum]XP_062521663.1 cytosolic phospholipase A2-like isoform X2 [Corticium candelabrum]
MDPYIRFEVTNPKGTADAVQKSPSIENDENPVWNPEYEATFVLQNPLERGQLVMTMWDASYLFDSQMSNSVSLDLNDFNIGDEYQQKTVKIHKNGEIDISLRLRSEREFEEDAIDYKEPTMIQGALDKELYSDPDVVRLDVIIHSASDLKRTLYRKLVDTFGHSKTDPYVQLHITKPWEKAKDAAKQNTAYRPNTDTPEWEEEFSFLIDKRGGVGQLKMTLWDSNLVIDHQLSSPLVIELKDIKMGLEFEEREDSVHGEAKLKYSLRIRRPTADLRFGQELHEEETLIVAKRKTKAKEAITSLFSDIKVSKVPTISLIGSGGGFRAMIGVSGAITALKEAELLDCCTYMSTLSGSTWYLSVLYALRNGMNIYKCNEYLKERCVEMSSIIHPSTVKQHFYEIERKHRDGLHVSAVDVWGSLLGQVLQPDLEKKERTRLSDAQQRVRSCQMPFPIYTAVMVQRHTAEEAYAEWVEFTPFEYGIHNLKLFTAIENSASDRSYGIVSRRYQQFNVAYMQGLWGSAFAGQIRTWISQAFEKSSGVRAVIGKAIKKVLDWTGVDSLRPLAATVPNYMKGIQTVPQTSQRRHQLHTNDFLNDHCFSFDSSQTDGSLAKKAKLVDDHTIDHRAGRVDESERAAEKSSRRNIVHEDYLTMVDAGLDFNLPFPPLLRPERHTDIFLAFDYSWYGSVKENPLKNVLKAMEWAKHNGYSFPEIREDMFDPDDPKKYYVFENRDDPYCPIVILFCLCNSEGQVDPYSSVYDTFNFDYKEKDFDRLHELCHNNTMLAVDVIKGAIRKKMEV